LPAAGKPMTTTTSFMCRIPRDTRRVGLARGCHPRHRVLLFRKRLRITDRRPQGKRKVAQAERRTPNNGPPTPSPASRPSASAGGRPIPTTRPTWPTPRRGC